MRPPAAWAAWARLSVASSSCGVVCTESASKPEVEPRRHGCSRQNCAWGASMVQCMEIGGALTAVGWRVRRSVRARNKARTAAGGWLQGLPSCWAAQRLCVKHNSLKARQESLNYDWGVEYKWLGVAQRLCASQGPQCMASLAPDASCQASVLLVEHVEQSLPVGEVACLMRKQCTECSMWALPAIRQSRATHAGHSQLDIPHET